MRPRSDYRVRNTYVNVNFMTLYITGRFRRLASVVIVISGYREETGKSAPMSCSLFFAGMTSNLLFPVLCRRLGSVGKPGNPAIHDTKVTVDRRW